MATVTGGGSTTFINLGSNETKVATTALANAISSALQAGSLTRVPDANTNPTTGLGVLTISTPNSTTTNKANVVVDLINAGGNAAPGSSSQVVGGSGFSNQQVLGDNENITYFTNGGGGTLIFGDGNNQINTPTVGGGDLFVSTGAGNDTIGISSGTATISAGPGRNLIYAGDPSNGVAFGGKLIVDASAGANNVDFTNRGSGATGTVTINNFGADDRIQLTGYTSDQRAAITTAAQAGGTATLSDGTKISFGTPAALTDASFIKAIGVYRFFDTKLGTHFFTSDPGERDNAIKTRPDLKEETNGFGALDPTSSDPNKVTVYRFFDKSFGTHFFTADAGERDTIIATRPDLSFEPSSTFIEDSKDAAPQPGEVAVYRLFDNVHGTHFYTGDQSEFAAITTKGTATYRSDLVQEGIAFYAPSGKFA